MNALTDHTAMEHHDKRMPEGNDAYIAIMGVTGVGKSTLISLCSEEPVEVGHGLESCTQKIALYPFQYHDRLVWLIDTPGFDDGRRTDTEILKELATWLSSSYKEEVYLNGIIYIHRITDVRLGGSAMRNLSMFKKLCGHDALKNVILSTTMWEKVTEEDGATREAELKAKLDYWGGMISMGSKVFRHLNTRESAMAMIEHLVDKPDADSTVKLEIQVQMVEDKLDLNETSAGREIDGGLTKKLENYQKEITEMREQAAQAHKEHNQQLATLMEEATRKKQEELQEIVAERQALQVDFKRLYEEKFAKMHEEYEAKLAASKQDNTDLQQKFTQERFWSPSMAALGPGMGDMDQWPISMCLFGPFYWFDAKTTDFGCQSALQDIPKERYPKPNRSGNRCVAIGESRSWYIQSVTKASETAYKYTTTFSENFGQIYPSAHRFLSLDHQNEDISCISLGTQGYYFIRSEAGCSFNLPTSIVDRVGDVSSVESIWLGKDGTFVCQRRTIDQVSKRESFSYAFVLNGAYPGLQEAIMAKEMRIQRIALNPIDESQYTILWPDGATRHSAGALPFDTAVYQKWCKDNFGTQWENKKLNVGDPSKHGSPMFVVVETEKGRKWYAPWLTKNPKWRLLGWL